MNRRAKFDTASFIFGGKIRNRTKNTQTLTDISTPCISACVDNNSALQRVRYSSLEHSGMAPVKDSLHSLPSRRASPHFAGYLVSL